MLAIDGLTSALAPALLLAGLALLILPWCRRDGAVARAGVFVAALALAVRYLLWRLQETVPAPELEFEALLAWGFALLEAATIVSSCFGFVLLARTRDRSPEADRHAAWWRPGPAPQVDVLIATYDEDAAILERTITGALAVRHDRMRVWVLDDKRRPWLREMAAMLGANYLTRPDNAHAKAGNINAALAVLRAQPVPPDFVAVLDADFVPHGDFLERSLALFHDPQVGLVQTPQHFFNADPIQHNLGIRDAYPDEQRFFFDHVQPARDAWGMAICCGTSSVVRWSALERIGGLPLGSVTEDYLLTLRLREEGFATVYLNEPLSEGLAPEGLAEYVTQRSRWCLGLMQILRGPLGPFARNRLRLRDRIGLIDSALYWLTTFPFRIAVLLVPLLYWLAGITLVDAPVEAVLGHFLPFFLAVMIATNWISRGHVVPVLNDVAQLLAARDVVRASAAGLLRPRGHPFRVTMKGGDRSRRVVHRGLLNPLALLFALTLAGLLAGIVTDLVHEDHAANGMGVMLGWSVYNLAVLGVAMAVCVERPRGGETGDGAGERVALFGPKPACSAWLTRLGPDEAWLHGSVPLAPGAACRLQLAGVGLVEADLRETGPTGTRLALRPDAVQRRAILRRLHTRDGARGTMHTSLAGLLRSAMRPGGGP